MTNQGNNAIDVLLAESFKELAISRPIEKITIREITDRAGVIRPTFYNHFQDKYELLEWIVNTELLDPMQPLLENWMLKEALTLSLTTMEKEKDFYTRAVRLEGQNSFASILKEQVSRLALERFDEKKIQDTLPKKWSWLTPKRTADFFAEELCYAVIEWVKDDMNVPMNEFIDMIIYVTDHSLADIISNLYR